MRNDITEMHFPDKVTIEEFFEILTDKEEIENFKLNMKDLKVIEDKYPEEWVHLFCAWMELV